MDDDYSENRPEDYRRFYSLIFKGILRRKFKKPSAYSLLDVGAGPGTNSLLLAKMGFNVTAIDLSEKAIALGKKRAKKEEVSVKFKVGDAEDLPFRDDSFDIIFCGAFLHHVPMKDKLAYEFARVLKKGGVVISYDPNALHPYGFFCHNVLNRFFTLKYFTKNERALSPSELKAAFGPAGFGRFRFNTVTLRTRKKGRLLRFIRESVYFICEKLLWGLRKRLFLVMVAEKTDDLRVL